MLTQGALRKALLTSHVVTSVGWLGAVLSFLVLSVAAVAAQDPATTRALYVAMEVLGRAVLVPLSLAALASGLLQSLTTPWGLFRHYWVVVKLSISVVATAVLLLYTSTLRLLGDVAASPDLADDAVLLPSMSPVVHSGAGLAVLVAAAVLSVFKPKGLTRYGWRQQRRRAAAGPGRRETAA